MRRNPLLLGDRIKRVINRDAILLSHVLIGGILTVDVLLNSSISWQWRISFFLYLSILGILGAIRYFNIFSINNHPAIHLTLYHLMIGAGLIIFAPIGSNYVFVWLILLFMTDFFYGLKVTIASGMVLAIVLELQLLWNIIINDATLNQQNVMTILVQYGIIVAIAIFFVDTQSVSDQDRHLLVTSMDKAQLERQRLVSLINSMADAVIATDDKGQIKLYNAASLNIFDTNEDLTGKQLRDFLILVDEKNNPVDVLNEAGEKNSNVHSRDLSLKYPNDEKINLSLSVSPIKLGFRRESERGFIITFRDITREKSLEDERDEFISVISHELRTPVAITEANISNAVFVAQNKNDIDGVLNSLKAAHKQAQFLANLLNDLSTLSRAEKGKLDLVPEELNPAEMVEDLYKDYLSEVETKGLKLVKEIDPKTPERIISNKLYVREILQNFVTNAVKYTREGSITISVENFEKGVKFKVSDTGIGISKSDQKKIFDKFFRSEDYRTRESSGTGLGLYITKKLASILSAKFEVESKLNKGSTFSVIIPDLTDQPLKGLGHQTKK